MADFSSTGDWKLDLLNFPALVITFCMIAVVSEAVSSKGFDMFKTS